MVKFSVAIFAVAAVVNVLPALAFEETLEYESSRSLDFLEENPVAARDLVEAVYGRELSDVELQEREPFLGLIFAAARIGAQIGTRVAGRVAGKVGSKLARKGAKKGAEHAHDHHERKKHRKRSLDEFEDEQDLMSRDDEMEGLLEIVEREHGMEEEVRAFDDLD
ncbi:hypothetical protein D9613_011662 [Agrocybe pediades]|uniref:Uncharacterized protein n=1 Tax=Agrocybe pediades TaxID=84607 RepID=A0A8H4QXT5_9AGAR|nr:hypothetical protein D9613_011662 [Agrocybe pediades]